MMINWLICKLQVSQQQFVCNNEIITLFMFFFLFMVDGFDVIVNDCYAHNGANKRIQLIDNNG